MGSMPKKKGQVGQNPGKKHHKKGAKYHPKVVILCQTKPLGQGRVGGAAFVQRLVKTKPGQSPHQSPGCHLPGSPGTLTVVKVAAGKIKLGITAPNNVKVRRLDALQAGTMENGEDSHEI